MYQRRHTKLKNEVSKPFGFREEQWGEAYPAEAHVAEATFGNSKLSLDCSQCSGIEKHMKVGSLYSKQS